MKKITLFFSAAILLVSLATTSSFVAPPPGPSANGQGSLTYPTETQQRRFAFHAKTMPNASVQGSGVLTYIGGVLKIKFEINCMTVTGNVATMSGMVTSHSTNPEYVGTACYFKVIDNGEGSNAQVDQMTALFINLPVGYPCVDAGGVLYPIEGGNIQVKN